ncbi:hypothetical protein BDP55DRAFT_649790 [Colletotrichum godetiae]|uniref:Uncharacterized protein n=1 Tax=Colletotrichum godetiae TaxID=1209918 RepID=A0AAJ0F004_9PEZI|nr:uncharacterized protein BDP55DRAFT_649790 [Colletotrichum godetiae]KAK1690146.1 hypothetical protein BDP55DRAFT_649790 [Colletotrichum godetiae]
MRNETALFVRKGKRRIANGKNTKPPRRGPVENVSKKSSKTGRKRQKSQQDLTSAKPRSSRPSGCKLESGLSSRGHCGLGPLDVVDRAESTDTGRRRRERTVPPRGRKSFFFVCFPLAPVPTSRGRYVDGCCCGFWDDFGW